MNGFEPLRRRIIDYTEAGQWSEVYDGLLEDCESEKLKAENAKLRELVRDMNECLEHSKPRCKKCKFQDLDCQWFKFIDRMRDLGVEVDE